MKKIILILMISSISIQAQTWQIIGEMPYPVYGGEAVVAGPLIYILGGFSYSLNTEVNLIQEYNPATGNWRIVDSLNVPRYGFTAGNYQDNIIIAGGVRSVLDFSTSIEMWNRVDRPFIYDNQADMLRRFAAGVIKDNKLFVFGGTDLDLLDSLTTYMYEYTIDSLSVTFRSNLNFSLAQIPSQQLSVNVDDDIYLFGGLLGTIAPSRSIFKYNINEHSLNELSLRLLGPRAGGRAVSTGENKIFIIGGFSGPNILSSVEIYEIKEGGDTITTGPLLNYARKEFMAVKFDNSILVFGGQDANGQPVAQIEMFDMSATTETDEVGYTKNLRLNNNYPNPFNPSTIISYSIPKRSFVLLKIYDILGDEVASLVNEEQDEGFYKYTFNPADHAGSGLSSGIYFYRVQVSDFLEHNSYSYSETKKMIYLK
jgi:N-acetylneuraminic acid mutarotase